MGKRYDDEPCEIMVAVHDSLFLEVAEEDELLEEYFASDRAIPTPLELSIFMRQMRSDPSFIARHENKYLCKKAFLPCPN